MEDLRIFHTDERRFLIVTDWNEYGKAAMQDEGGEVRYLRCRSLQPFSSFV